MSTNKKWVFKSYFQGDLTPDKFELVESAIPDNSELQEGQILVKLTYASLDPYMRRRLNPDNTFSPVKPGTTFNGMATAIVVFSNSKIYKEGDYITGFLDWSLYSIKGDREVFKVEVGEKLSPSLYLGALGFSGFSAYFPIIEYVVPRFASNPSKTAFISGAAGSVGVIVGQILKNVYGWKIYGSAGSADKIKFLQDELKFDGVFNYRESAGVENLSAKLKSFEPEGFDLFWDNVGGEMLDATFLNMKRFGLIIICGAISEYNVRPEERYGLKNSSLIFPKSLTVQGFNVQQYIPRREEGLKELKTWYLEGKLRNFETVAEGFDHLVPTLVDLFKGANTGKMVVKV